MSTRRATFTLLLTALMASAAGPEPRITYRLESNAVFTNNDRSSVLYPDHYPPDEWDEHYLHEFRVFLKGRASPRVGYRVEPRFWITYRDQDDADSTETFDWVLDQAYGYVDFTDRLTFLAGKQRVRWGTGMTYTPTDRWQAPPNSLDPTRYLEGVYVFRVDAHLPLASLTAVYAPQRQRMEHSRNRQSVAGVRLFKLIGTTDLYLSATRVLSDDEEETNLGGAFAWDSGPAVIYGEATYLRLGRDTLPHLLGEETGETWRPRMLLGASRQFGGNSSAYLEAYYNDWGLDRDQFCTVRQLLDRFADLYALLPPGSFEQQRDEVLSLGTPARSLHQWYVAANGTYVYHDAWSIAGNMIVEPVDGTLFAYPIVSYIGFQSVDLAAGYSSVWGSDESERALLPSHHAVDFRFVVHF